MKHPEYCWRDTAFEGVQKRNAVMEASQIASKLPPRPVDCYATWHRFPESYRTHAQETGSTRGYKGPSYADFLPFDFDGDNLAAVLDGVRNFLKVLQVTYEIDNLTGVRCYFSGKKGFHVYLSPVLFGGWSPSATLPGQLRRLAITMAPETADTAIYDQNRLLRFPDTQHRETGLYKIQLDSPGILFSPIEQILQLAKEPQTVSDDWSDAAIVKDCQMIFKSVMEEPVAEPALQRQPLFPILTEGQGREKTSYRIACTLRDRGRERSVALEVLKLWDAQQIPPLTSTDGFDILEKKIQNAYRDATPGNNSVISVDDIRTPLELADDYSGYIEKLKERKISLGWVEVDTTMRGIAPGEVVTIIAKSGVGKTAVLQNILVWLCRQRVTNLFCSMEQPLAQCFERFAQMVTGQSGTVIEENWHQEGQAIRDLLDTKMGQYTLTCGTPNLSLPQLDQALDAAEAKTGKPVEVLAIDYMGLLDTHDLDNTLYGQVSRAARELKNVAKRRDLVVILLCQVNRAAGDEGDTPLTMHSGRESGAIEESADFLIGLYRPDIKTENRRICLQLLKSRKGALGMWELEFDTASLRITSK